MRYINPTTITKSFITRRNRDATVCKLYQSRIKGKVQDIQESRRYNRIMNTHNNYIGHVSRNNSRGTKTHRQYIRESRITQATRLSCCVVTVARPRGHTGKYLEHLARELNSSLGRN